MTSNEETRGWAKDCLSESRFDSYLRLCDDDPDLALQLHEWNLKLGQSLMGDGSSDPNTSNLIALAKLYKVSPQTLLECATGTSEDGQ